MYVSVNKSALLIDQCHAVDAERIYACVNTVATRAELTTDLPKIMADRVQLQQAFMNLMLNAIEAMKDCGGELTVKSQLQDGQLQFSASDTGVGLPRKKLDQIFLRSLPPSRRAAAWDWPSAVPFWSRMAASCGRRLITDEEPPCHFTLPTQ